MSETFYDVLGVAEDATTDEIETAYRERLKETHPDVSDAADAREVTQTLVEARDVLVDEAERARYDRLGHDAYVGRESSAGVSDAAEAARNAGYGDVGDRTADPPSESERRDARKRARERAERERRASERVRTDSETRTEDYPDDGQTAATDATTESGWDAGTEAVGGYGGADGQRRHAGSAYAVRGSVQTGPGYDRLVPSGRELTLLGITFVLYPVLLFSALVPAFPLFVNLVLGFCIVLVVGYLQSLPRIALLVFGGWSLVTPLVLVALDVGLLSLVGFLALCGTWLPFGFTVLTYSVLRL